MKYLFIFIMFIVSGCSDHESQELLAYRAIRERVEVLEIRMNQVAESKKRQELVQHIEKFQNLCLSRGFKFSFPCSKALEKYAYFAALSCVDKMRCTHKGYSINLGLDYE